MSGAYGEWDLFLLAGLLLATLTSLVVMLGVYFLWIRRLNLRIVEMQIHLFKLASLLQKNNAEPELVSPVYNGKRIAISLEGHPVEIIEVEGRETVRFGEELPEAERSRLLTYLRNEGFIS